MPQFLNDLLSNHILLAAFIGYLAAQVVKVMIEFAIDRTFSVSRLFTGNGGMPSSHSATVCALATMAAFECGLQSPAFAVSVIFAIVVMTDASGVRRETGNQAVILNQMMEHFRNMAQEKMRPEFSQEKLKELIGHTPSQVRVGGALGIVISLVLHFAFWR